MLEIRILKNNVIYSLFFLYLISENRPRFKRNNPPQRSISLSGGIQQAIANTTDNPESLIIFLNHVRGRKERKLKEITLAFTDNVPDLIEQLESVEKNYYTSVATRGASEDKDLKFMENLRKRLKSLFSLTRTGLTSSDSD